MKKALVLSIILSLTFAAQAQKKALSTSDFAGWKRIEKRQISNNGKFIAYERNEQKGNGELIIQNTETNTADTIPFGYSAKFSPNSDFIAFKYKPASDSTRAAKKAEVKKDKMPKDSLGIYNFATNETLNFLKVKSYAVPKEEKSWVAVLVEHIEPKKDTTAIADTTANNETIKTEKTKVEKEDETDKPKKKKEKDLKDLFVLNPISGFQTNFNHVQEYVFAKNGKTLGVVTKEKDSLEISTIIAFNTELQTTDTVFRDTGFVKKMTLGSFGNHLAFLYSKDTIDEKVHALYLSNLNKNSIQIVVDTLTKGMPANWAPSENGSVYFSDDATKLFFGTTQKPTKQPEDSLLAEEKPKLDIWSWTDIELQPMQLINLEKEIKRTYTALYRITDKIFIQVADTTIKQVSLINKNNGEFALGSNDTPYTRAMSWSAKWISDYYLIDLIRGNKKQILAGKKHVQLSPTGKYIIWYEQNDSSYYAITNKTGKKISLTKSLKVPFYNELHDMPTQPGTHGIAGWNSNDESIYIYDRYDIWKIDPTGKNIAVNITNNFGRDNKIRLRYIKLDNELVFLPTNENIVLKGFDENSYQAGYYTALLSRAKSPIELLKGNYRVGSVTKAKHANQIIWSTQTVENYPEIKLSNLSFKDAKTVSKANPQQKDFNWATTEKVKWNSFSGEELKGTLYKPENFDASKKYPMMVYFYERNSESIHRHYTPYPSHSTINKIFYASNEYLVFIPDITYKTGYPGQSAYNAIVSGTQYLINSFEFVDAKRIALQGQSWGGYQIAYLVTQTDLYAAAMAGAPVSNMTSAYGAIRWGSGMSRMFQYEHTQSRIGGTLWEKPMQYIENSPVFYAPKVNTPLLIMHNDKDGAVPWYQGIEYFVALRRLNKPAWMLTYNGMKHNIETKYWANRMDLSKRMFQFFNHYLKDEPAPEWMIKGVPAIEKGENLGY